MVIVSVVMVTVPVFPGCQLPLRSGSEAGLNSVWYLGLISVAELSYVNLVVVGLRGSTIYNVQCTMYSVHSDLGAMLLVNNNSIEYL